MFRDSRVYVAGHGGLLGTALLKRLSEEGCRSVITASREELDLTNQAGVTRFFEKNRPEYIFLAAGLTGGIIANRTYPADFLHTNLSIQDNVFEAAVRHGCRALVFYGSSCIYPKDSPQPMKEDYVLTGPIEKTSAAYAMAKMAGIEACRAYNEQHKATRFIALVPNSMYGPNDNFDLESSHVLSALIRKLTDAKREGNRKVVLWGSGAPRREFIYSADVADASIFAVRNAGLLENTFYNVGTGVDCSIKELAGIIAGAVGYEGVIEWDTSKPDGAPRKLLDSTRFLSLGWAPATRDLEAGIRAACEWYLEKQRVTEAAC